MKYMLTQPFKNRCIGARVNLWKSKTCPVTPSFKIFLWLSHHQRRTKKSLWWLPKRYVVWPWTPILTASTSFFSSHTVLLLVFKLTKLISVSGPWYFSPPLPELLFPWICAWLPFLLPWGLYSNISHSIWPSLATGDAKNSNSLPHSQTFPASMDRLLIHFFLCSHPI